MNKPVAVIDHESHEVAPPSNVASMMEGIMRAASDPNTDVSKLERLMAMYERLEERAAERNFNVAMLAAQEEMDPVRTDANNPQTKSRYATYAALDRAIRPIYTKHGFAISFDTGDAPQDHIRVLCIVSHRAGFTRTYHIDMPADGKGAKGGDVMTKTHAVGSAFSYGKRYVAGGIFNIIVSDSTDDDGNSAGGLDGPITADQLATLQEVIDRTKSDIELVCKHFHLDSLKAITKRQYPRVMEAINTQPTKKPTK